MLPERKQKFVGMARAAKEPTLLDCFNLERFTKWKLLIHTTARVFLVCQRLKARSPLRLEPEVKDLENAERMWIMEAQKGLQLDKLKRLCPTTENGLVLVGGRTERWMQATWNRQKFVLLPGKHPISMLIARYFHEIGGHLGINAKITIVSKCLRCKKKLMRMSGQVMSPLPIERLRPGPPFENICIDYFGPYLIRGEVQKRIRGKCWGVILTCIAVRAVYIDVAFDCSTDGFLQLLRRFASLRGWPRKIFSDPATNLVGASNELKEQIKGLDWKRIEEFGHQEGFQWKFAPADAPWYNGTAEALIKSTKRALDAAVGVSVLSFSELQTCMMEAAQLVNQRPIGALPSTPDDGTYLCPNDLILGRSSAKIPQGPFQERASRKYRLDFIEALVSAFWKRWTREVFPNLVLQPKWHTEERNLQAGDVVLVKDSNSLRGKWKMARVKQAHISEESTKGPDRIQHGKRDHRRSRKSCSEPSTSCTGG